MWPLERCFKYRLGSRIQSPPIHTTLSSVGRIAVTVLVDGQRSGHRDCPVHVHRCVRLAHHGGSVDLP